MIAKGTIDAKSEAPLQDHPRVPL
jgi:hypothetical protein